MENPETLTELNAHTTRPNMTVKVEFTVGILLCGRIRDFLEKCKFDGMDIEWREGRGWIERDWTIRGDPTAIQMIYGSIQAWIRDNRLSDGT